MLLTQTPTFEQMPSFLAGLADEVLSIKQLLSSSEQGTEIEKPTDVKGAAEFTNLEEPTIYALVRKREIPFHKRNKRLYFFRSELLAWIKSGKGQTIDDLVKSAENQFLKANKAF